jgi:NAD(P)-dependent dehydrogenase (short-subunit alcohol dehydrogenase family)
MKTIDELISLKGRTAIITGASGHLGQHIALTIAELGGSLILVDKPHSNFSLLISMLKKNQPEKVECFECDLEDEEDRRRLISEINEDHSVGLSILINNAAFGGDTDLTGWVAALEDQSIETWRRAMEVNLTAATHPVKSVSPPKAALLMRILNPTEWSSFISEINLLRSSSSSKSHSKHSTFSG